MSEIWEWMDFLAQILVSFLILLPVSLFFVWAMFGSVVPRKKDASRRISVENLKKEVAMVKDTVYMDRYPGDQDLCRCSACMSFRGLCGDADKKIGQSVVVPDLGIMGIKTACRICRKVVDDPIYHICALSPRRFPNHAALSDGPYHFGCLKKAYKRRKKLERRQKLAMRIGINKDRNPTPFVLVAVAIFGILGGLIFEFLPKIREQQRSLINGVADRLIERCQLVR